ncbi:MAG: alpha/beta hydrolase [Propionibacteriaceae bacterium]|mgnify:CR=1 FL=1|nr:alpha/beta hydrolase [Propionibacteriaceae bacterium]
MSRYERPHIAFLHGLGGTPNQWISVMEECMPWADCFAPQLPWSWSNCYSWWGDIEDAEIALCSAIAGYDVVVTHSFATSVMINALAAGKMAVPEALVFLAPLFRGHRSDFPFDEIERMLRTYQGCLVASLGNRIREPVNVPDLWAKARIARAALGTGAWTAFLYAYVSTAADRRLPSVPALIIKGMYDRVSPRSDAQSLQGALPGSLLLVGDFGHFPMLERQEALAEMLHDGLCKLGVLTSAHENGHRNDLQTRELS